MDATFYGGWDDLEGISGDLEEQVADITVADAKAGYDRYAAEELYRSRVEDALDPLGLWLGSADDVYGPAGLDVEWDEVSAAVRKVDPVACAEACVLRPMAGWDEVYGCSPELCLAEAALAIGVPEGGFDEDAAFERLIGDVSAAVSEAGIVLVDPYASGAWQPVFYGSDKVTMDDLADALSSVDPESIVLACRRDGGEE